MKRNIHKIVAIGVLFSSFAFLSYPLAQNVSAAGVNITATPNEVASATATDITFTYTASNAVEASGTTYTFVVSPTLPGALTNCTSADGFADSNGTDGAGSFGSLSTTGATFTTTTATSTTGRSLCLKFPSDTASQSYGVSIISSTGDFGVALVHYVDNNDVTVTAVVGPSLSFNIRDLGDTADTNVCDLGSVDTTTAVDLDTTDDGVGECGYSLAIGTNAATGYTATIQGSANGLYNGAHTMANVAGAYNAGTEEYGLANVTLGAGLTNVTKGGSFTGANGYAIPTSATTIASSTGAVVYEAGTDATDVIQIVHGLTVDSSTPTGNYTQTITYQATTNF